jgi:peptide/nickel transport system permease protein
MSTVSQPAPRRSSTHALRFVELIGRRILHAVPVLIGITLITFMLVHLLPGNPADAIAGVRATPQVVHTIDRQLGLDKPLVNQYLQYLGRVARGDLGHSYLSGDAISPIVAARLPATLFLIAYSAILALVAGVPLALIAAGRRDRLADHLIRGTLVLLLGVPSFWLGIMLVTYAALKLGAFPSSGYGSGFVQHITHLFLPAFTLAVTFLAVLVRSLRASIIEVVNADYVNLARLKGIPRRRVYIRHVMRNALRPAITIVGLNMSFLLGASLIVESVFGVNGIGNTMVQAVSSRDLPLVEGITLVFGVVVLLITLLVDCVQLALDPRSTT